ncbi:fumarylacetoacetate hydrolase family protein [Pseudolysinimonas yzui]|uniref:Hydroxylase n=1 Tax=Pseudolysinimonas yzui TaxID=2708254 RepID=A0A8J3GRJ0_9MICO|nr:fumarylacetoacetate hydrolase family protein [Pseudolysinimonas yzui]GHF19030.1 hydroxylase [Pseudolysinimonas yzui]
MRFARWRQPGDPAVHEGVMVGERLGELPAGVGIQQLLEAGLTRALEIGADVEAGLTDAAVRLDDVTLLPPLRPATIRDFVTFEEHVEGMTAGPDGTGNIPAEWYEFPTFYFTNPHSVIATGDPVIFPAASVKRDFELEVAAVIGAVPGRDGAHLAPDEAGAHIFGYTIMNDWSARDVQFREMAVKLGPAKGKDFATTLGPVLVTADEVADLVDAEGFLQLEVEVLVNGVTIGTDLLSNMGWPFAELVAYASRDTRVVPGDVLGSGTAGRGCLAELWGRAGELVPAPLVPGDEVVIRVERLGEIRNVLGESRVTPAIPPARPRSRARTRAAG